MATTEPISRRYWLDQIFVMPLLNKAEAFLGIIFYGFVNAAGDYKGVMTPVIVQFDTRVDELAAIILCLLGISHLQGGEIKTAHPAALLGDSNDHIPIDILNRIYGTSHIDC